jgi:threonine aldolase
MPTTPPPIDLRSDTVTKPSAAMRRAIAEAEVGDDVYGEDPTVAALEARVAELLGVEAALFVPTGSMANQIAIAVHTRPGDEILLGAGAHSYLYEAGATPVLTGTQMHVLPGDGRFTAADVRAAFKPDSHLQAPTRLVMIENTHNLGGGLVWDAGEVAAVQATARELGLALHLDGARLWNAAIADGKPERALAAGFDTISVCLSKGLGAPVGSLLCGRRDLVHRGHRLRKMFGGGMRQVGVLAAAGLYAIEHNRARLRDDHANAAAIADALAGVPGLTIDRARVMTNLVFAEVAPELGGAPAIAARVAERGVKVGALGARLLRMVTHLDVDRAACERAAAIVAEAVRGAPRVA